MTMTGDLERGRAAFAVREWADASKALELVGHAQPLTPEDLELLATSAHMTGRHDSRSPRPHAVAMSRSRRPTWHGSPHPPA